jgi:formate hydrogenlyase subunit 3/multisubunit Na+/H+ antiporter MnhD subunit
MIPEDFPWIVGPVAWPLLVGILVFGLGRRAPRGLAVGGTAITAASLVPVTGQVVRDGTVRHAVGGWGAPLGIELRADGLSLVLLWLTATVALAVAVYASSYFRARRAISERLWPLWFLLMAGLHALFLSADLFNAYVALELVTLTAVPLVAVAGGPAGTPALRYLMFALLGSLTFLLGVALLYGAHGVLDMGELATVVHAHETTALASALVTVGLITKSAIFPLHAWLPPAHASAPSPVSAVLSALVVKGSLYLLLRLWLFVLPEPPWAVAQLMGGLGAGAVAYGAVQALRQSRLKMVVAYSTVAQLGYVLLVFPLSQPVGRMGAIIQLLAHGLAKAALFLSAGNVLHTLGHDRVRELHAARPTLSTTYFAFALAGVSLMGLPPTAGFLAKWHLLIAALEVGQWWWAAVLLSGGLLAGGYLFRVLRCAFVPAAAPAEAPGAVSPAMQGVPLGLALAAWALGFGGEPLLRVLDMGPISLGRTSIP